MIARRKDHWLMKADPALRDRPERRLDTEDLGVSYVPVAPVLSTRGFARDTEEHIDG